MELLEEFYEKDADPSKEDKGICYMVRKAARAVLFNEDKEVALMYVSKKDYHKLPGGGIEKGENISTALEREIIEETGYTIQVNPQSVGATIEYRDAHTLLQISYCYMADVTGKPVPTALTEEEAARGMQMEWMRLEDAIGALEKDSPTDYVGHFIRRRDLAFLRKANEMLGERYGFTAEK